MKGNEKQVLKIVTELNEADCKTIARKIGISSGYADEICLDLLEDGYLIQSSNGKYKVTAFTKQKLSPIRTRGPIRVLKGGG